MHEMFKNVNNSLKHHFPDSGGDSLSWCVIPNQFWVFMSALKDVYSSFSIVPHGIHEDTWQKTHQYQTHLWQKK